MGRVAWHGRGDGALARVTATSSSSLERKKSEGVKGHGLCPGKKWAGREDEGEEEIRGFGPILDFFLCIFFFQRISEKREKEGKDKIRSGFYFSHKIILRLSNFKQQFSCLSKIKLVLLLWFSN